MSPDKVVEALDACRALLVTRVDGAHPPFEPTRCKTKEVARTYRESLEHCLWMIDEAKAFATGNQLGKAFRWLGFIQGAMWGIGGLASIEQLKKMNTVAEGDAP